MFLFLVSWLILVGSIGCELCVEFQQATKRYKVYSYYDHLFVYYLCEVSNVDCIQIGGDANSTFENAPINEHRPYTHKLVIESNNNSIKVLSGTLNKFMVDKGIIRYAVANISLQNDLVFLPSRGQKCYFNHRGEFCYDKVGGAYVIWDPLSLPVFLSQGDVNEWTNMKLGFKYITFQYERKNVSLTLHEKKVFTNGREFWTTDKDNIFVEENNSNLNKTDYVSPLLAYNMLRSENNASVAFPSTSYPPENNKCVTSPFSSDSQYFTQVTRQYSTILISLAILNLILITWMVVTFFKNIISNYLLLRKFKDGRWIFLKIFSRNWTQQVILENMKNNLQEFMIAQQEAKPGIVSLPKEANPGFVYSGPNTDYSYILPN